MGECSEVRERRRRRFRTRSREGCVDRLYTTTPCRVRVVVLNSTSPHIHSHLHLHTHTARAPARSMANSVDVDESRRRLKRMLDAGKLLCCPIAWNEQRGRLEAILIKQSSSSHKTAKLRELLVVHAPACGFRQEKVLMLGYGGQGMAYCRAMKSPSECDLPLPFPVTHLTPCVFDGWWWMSYKPTFHDIVCDRQTEPEPCFLPWYSEKRRAAAPTTARSVPTHPTRGGGSGTQEARYGRLSDVCVRGYESGLEDAASTATAFRKRCSSELDEHDPPKHAPRKRRKEREVLFHSHSIFDETDVTPP